MKLQIIGENYVIMSLIVNLYSMPNIVRAIKSKRMKLAGPAAWEMRREINSHRILVRNLKRSYFRVDEAILLKRILRNRVQCRLDSATSGQG
jgi:hypothetical protein